jgi:hypothetical protein
MTTIVIKDLIERTTLDELDEKAMADVHGGSTCPIPHRSPSGLLISYDPDTCRPIIEEWDTNKPPIPTQPNPIWDEVFKRNF